MSTVLPPSATTVTLPNGGAPVVVTAVGDAKAVAALQAGATLEVVAQGRPSKGVLEVMTAAGPLQLKVLPPATLPPIPDGARLLLQVGGGGGLNMLAINGRPLAGVILPGVLPGGLPGSIPPGGTAVAGQPAQMPGMPGTPAPITAGPGALAAPSAPAGPMGITATVIRPAMPAQGMPPAPQPGQTLPPNLPAGTRITVRIAGIEPPPALPGAPAGPAAAPGLPPPHAAQQRPPVMASAASPSIPQPGAQMGPQPAAGAPAPLLAGTVTAHPPGGQAVLSTTIGTVALPTAAPLSVGSVVRLEVVAPPQPPPSPPSSPPAARPEGLTAQGWPALSEAMETLARTDPQALEMLMRSIPAAGPRLAAAMVAFTVAMKSGDGKGVIGEAPGKALEKAGRRDLAERLKADLSDLAQDCGRPVGGGDWRMHTMPFSYGGQVDPVRLFVRGPAAEEERRRAGGTGNDQRFILDFNLSSLGRLQLDGLVRREDKLFDLIIRTGEPLPQQMRMDIMAIFAQAAELVGTKGTVAFQAGGRWLDIRTDPIGPTCIEV